MEPGSTLCTFFHTRVCRYQQRCIFQHGESDLRLKCIDCKNVRVAPEMQRCHKCYQVHKTCVNETKSQVRADRFKTNLQVREDRFKANQVLKEAAQKRKLLFEQRMTICQGCGRTKRILPGSSEYQCTKCDTECSTPGCMKMTLKEVCHSCRTQHKTYEIYRCQYCDGRIYPDQTFCVNCNSNKIL